jgi:arylformamidase
MMRIVDITRPLGADTPVYPGDPPIVIERLSESGDGDTYALSRLTLGSHSGTHVDPPAHFIPGGASIDRIPLDACIGPAVVIDLSGQSGPISPAALGPLPDGTERVLIRTADPPLGGRALEPATARYLVERGLRLVGIDTLSIAPPDSPGEVHRILLSAGLVVVEGLDLSVVPPGPAVLICLPLRIAGCDGAPARAVLLYDA